VKLFGEEREHLLAIGLRGEAAVAVAAAELLQLIVQIAHSPSWAVSVAVFVSRQSPV
jgi:hypothetical protein